MDKFLNQQGIALIKRLVKDSGEQSGLLKEIVKAFGEKSSGITLNLGPELADALKVQSPKKGVDYFTEDDKQELVELVIPLATPKRGIHYFTQKDVEAIKRAVKPRKGIDYIDGYTPKKGVDYFTKQEVRDFLKLTTPKKGIDYRDGKDADPEKIIKEVLKRTKDVRSDKERAKEIVRLLETLKGKERLDAKAIKNIPIGGGASITSESDPLAIKKDGTTTTTASIPFAQGISIADTKVAYWGGTADADARGKIYNDNNTFIVRALANTSDSGAHLLLRGGDADIPDVAGGMTYLRGGDYAVGGDILQNGFVATGTSITGFTASANIGGALVAGNSTSDFAVGGAFYAASNAIFAANGIAVGGKLCPSTYAFLGSGESAFIIGLDRKNSGGTNTGVNLTIHAGWATTGTSNVSSGNLILAPGTATGTGTGNVQLQAVGGGSSGTSDRSPITMLTVGYLTLTVADTCNFVFNTSTGTKFGTATSQKIGFFNATPVVQQTATTDLGTALSNLGLRASGTAYPITTSGAVSFTGTIGLGGQITISDAINIAINTTTGTKIGTATGQKIGFWNATPIVQPTTAVAAATFVANTSGIANDSATFDGYTIGQVVKALRNIGLLA